MHVKIQTSEKGGNIGSCSDYANYLDKENENKPADEQEYFFSCDRDRVQTFEVINEIDSNKGKLNNKEAKFYSITISPSKEELSHIGNDSDILKNFVRSVMDEYAKNFNRSDKGVNSGKDLVYFAKLENERKYKGNDREVLNTEYRQGELKQGDNRHVHVIVSRMDKNQYTSLGALASSKGHIQTNFGKKSSKGFDRMAFDEKVEQIFDLETGYKRSLEETFKYKLDQSKLKIIEKINNSKQSISNKMQEPTTDQKNERKNQQGFDFNP